MMLIFTPPVADGGVLGEDRDALLALEVHRVEHALGHVLVRAKGAGLPQHGVDQRGLAVVDVRHDRDVAYVLAGEGHAIRLVALSRCAAAGAGAAGCRARRAGPPLGGAARGRAPRAEPAALELGVQLQLAGDVPDVVRLLGADEA